MTFRLLTATALTFLLLLSTFNSAGAAPPADGDAAADADQSTVLFDGQVLTDGQLRDKVGDYTTEDGPALVFVPVVDRFRDSLDRDHADVDAVVFTDVDDADAFLDDVARQAGPVEDDTTTRMAGCPSLTYGARLYEDDNCAGAWYGVFFNETVTNLSTYGWNDRADSIAFDPTPSGCVADMRVRLYLHSGLSGSSAIYSSIAGSYTFSASYQNTYSSYVSYCG